MQVKGQGLGHQMSETKAAVERITWNFPVVKNKMMFGCESYFFGPSMFVILWKTGKIGVKITNLKKYESLLTLNGTEPWFMGKMKMDHWILLPEHMIENTTDLFNWLKEAFESVGGKTTAKAPIPEKKHEPVVIHKTEPEMRHVEEIKKPEKTFKEETTFKKKDSPTATKKPVPVKASPSKTSKTTSKPKTKIAAKVTKKPTAKKADVKKKGAGKKK